MSSQIEAHFNAPLEHLNTFGVPATTAALVEINRIDETQDALKEIAATLPAPILVLGDGSNVLFTRDFPGTIVRFRSNYIGFQSRDSDNPILCADAGASWHRLVLTAAKEGLWGIENLALIPGTCGAAPIQNIGAYGVELTRTLHLVEAFRLDNAEAIHFSPEQCELGYRTSRFRDRQPDTYLIARIKVQLSRKPNPHLEYPGLADEMAGEPINPLRIAHAVSRLRQQKLPDPHSQGNAGSFFKNPHVTNEQLAALLADIPDLPHFAASENEIKLSAAWLIEHCSWKGFRDGAVGVSPKHSLVLVNYSNGTGDQILALANKISASVQERFGVMLDPEPRVI